MNGLHFLLKGRPVAPNVQFKSFGASSLTKDRCFGDKNGQVCHHFFRHQHTNNHAFKTDDSCLVKCIDGDIKMSIFGFYHSDFFRRRVEGEKYFQKTGFCVGTCVGGHLLWKIAYFSSICCDNKANYYRCTD